MQTVEFLRDAPLTPIALLRKSLDNCNDTIKNYLFSLVVADLSVTVYFSHTQQSCGIFFHCFQRTALKNIEA
jgi:hypothetical protein